MEFNAEYVLRNYYHERYGAEFVRYPGKNPSRLLATFAAVTPGGETFHRIEQFWSETKEWGDTEFLFFRDRPNTEYADIQPFIEVIADCTANSDCRVFTCGSSMGAYAAMSVACRLPSFGALLTAPRWRESRTCQDFRDFIGECATPPRCYVEARGLPEDQEVLRAVTETYRSKGGICLFRSMPERYEHWGIDLWDAGFTLFLMSALEQWKVA